MRKFLLLVSAVALSVATLTACFGGPPPPPPTDPHDVLVVGDSVAFSFGCVLGDAISGVPAGSCPSSPDYTTKNFSIGGCTIYGSAALLYSGATAPVPNCDTVPAGDDQRTWAQAADYYVPKVVVINTGGWEIVDRWLSNVAGAPNSQWGGPETEQVYKNAAVYYSAALYNAISAFRARGAKVLVANQPNVNPLQPEPDPATVPAGLGCSWWEAYPDNPPTAVGDPPLSPLTCPGQWRSPTGNTTYRSSRLKFNQFNAIINQVLTDPDPQLGFGSDPNVASFNFKRHFNQPGTDAYTDWICPPPQDSTVAAQNVLDWHTTGDLTDTAWQCNNGQLNSAANPWPYAISARAPDNGHLSPDGQFSILQPYLDSCVKFLLGKPGGSQADCA